MPRELGQWEKEFPGRVETIFNNLQRVTPSHLLDRELFDFPAVAAAGNVNRHEYEAVDERQLWHTVHHSLESYPSTRGTRALNPRRTQRREPPVTHLVLGAGGWVALATPLLRSGL